MSVTTSTDLHSIDQVGSAAVDIAFTAVPFLGIPSIAVNLKGRISDAGGDSITMPVWETDLTDNPTGKRITQTAVRDSRTGVTPSKIKLNSYTETAATKVISIDGDQFALEDSSESALAHIANVVGHEFAREIQGALITKAGSTDLSHSADAQMTVADILKARLKWGDRSSEIGNPYLFMHSSQFADLCDDEDFKSMAAGGSATPILPEGDWTRFIVAQVYGVRIVLCDSLPSVANTSKTAMLIGENALGIYVANQPKTVIINNPGTAVKTIDTHFRFASTLIHHNPRRVVKLVTVESTE